MKRSPAIFAFVPLVLLIAWEPASSQIPYPGGGYPGRYPYPGRGTGLPPPVRGGRQPKNQKDKPPDELLATFTGTVKGSDSKMLNLEDAEGNRMQFHCSKKTTYLDGSKKIKASALKSGDQVSVEGRRAPDGTLDAVNVRLEHQKT